MKLGFIGAGEVAVAIARNAIAAGHDVVLTSRSPETAAKAASGLGQGASAGSISEVAASDIVLLAVPWPNVADALAALPDWSGKILVDTTNPFAQTTPKLVLADLGERSSSEIVAITRLARVSSRRSTRLRCGISRRVPYEEMRNAPFWCRATMQRRRTLSFR